MRAMRTCPRCGRSLPPAEFNFKVRRTGRRQVYCRGCSRELIRDHYRRNVGYYVAKARARNAITRQAFHDRILAYLAEHPCVDCGQADPVVLDFDHVDRATKSRDVATMMKEC